LFLNIFNFCFILKSIEHGNQSSKSWIFYFLFAKEMIQFVKVLQTVLSNTYQVEYPVTNCSFYLEFFFSSGSDGYSSIKWYFISTWLWTYFETSSSILSSYTISVVKKLFLIRWWCYCLLRCLVFFYEQICVHFFFIYSTRLWILLSIVIF